VVSQKMGIHEWSYDNDISADRRFKVPLRDKVVALADIKAEVELGYDVQLALKEAERCLNCDIQTVFTPSLCIECDACVDICPMDCITFTTNGDEADLRTRLRAPARLLGRERRGDIALAQLEFLAKRQAEHTGVLRRPSSKTKAF
jgi:ferredoxin